MNSKVSVIVPVYNTNDYLDKCIDSIVNQTLKELEIILVDDGSNDGSSDKLDDWAQRDSRIVVIHKSKNVGVSDSRNIGLEISHGKYVSFIDSDDWLDSDMLECLVDLLDTSESDMALCGYKKIMTTGITYVKPKIKSEVCVDKETVLKHCIPRLCDGLFDGYIWNKLYKKDSLYNKGTIIKFENDLFFAEDYVWLITVILNNNRFVFSEKCGYNYRSQRKGNAQSNIGNDLRYVTNAIKSKELVWHCLENAKSQSANSAFQFMLYHRKIGMRTSNKLLDWKHFNEYKASYLDGLIKWFCKDKTVKGLVWTLKEMAWILREQLIAIKKKHFMKK